MAPRDAQVFTEKQQEEHQTALHQANAAVSKQNYVGDRAASLGVDRGDGPHAADQNENQERPTKQDNTQVAQGFIGTERILEDFLQHRKRDYNTDPGADPVSVVVQISRMPYREQEGNTQYLKDGVVEKIWVFLVQAPSE